jgi:hypothetical protein
MAYLQCGKVSILTCHQAVSLAFKMEDRDPGTRKVDIEPAQTLVHNKHGGPVAFRTFGPSYFRRVTLYLLYHQSVSVGTAGPLRRTWIPHRS